METDASFGAWVRRRRRALDLTQHALAQQVGCARITIQKIEVGERRPSREFAALLAERLHVPPAERDAFLHAARSDLAMPQLGDPTRPAATIAALRPRSPGNLPARLTPCIGRERELAQLRALLANATCRLITITGPGGVGKTRLAIALAERLLANERFLDDVCFVPLAPLTTPEQILPALAEALSFPLDTGKHHVRSPRQQVLDYLREKQLLLVFDNVEHLLDDADEGAGVTDLIAALLEAAPRVALLATSRERLNVRAEHLYPLGGLDLPSAATLSSYSAVALFLQRARPLRPDFVPDQNDLGVLVQICRLVEGMPLAIELAAGWVDTLSLRDIAEEIARGLDVLVTELRDVPARHRSMRAVFSASWRRLGAADQSVFARLAVFRGGGSRRAVQAVAGATLVQLHALVGASLLQYDAERDRYTTHELLRQYAAEQLAADPQNERAACERHAAYYCAFVAERTEALKGAGQDSALRTIEAEAANLQAALAWAGAHGAVTLVDRALEGLGYFYQWRGRYQEGQAAFGAVAEALAATDASDTRRVQTHALAWQAVFARLLGQPAHAEGGLRSALAMLDTLAGIDTRVERAFVLLQLGDLVDANFINAEESKIHYTASLALYQELERPWEQSCALRGLGDNARYCGDLGAARQYLHECRAIRVAVNDRRGLAEALNYEAQVAVETGATDEALDLARRSCTLYEELGDPAGRAFGMARLGLIQLWTGCYPEAQHTLAASRALYNELGDQPNALFDDSRLVFVIASLGDLDAAWALATKTIDRSREILEHDDPQALWVGGMIALLRCQFGEAAELLQASVALYEQLEMAAHAGRPRAWLAAAHWLLGRQAEAHTDVLTLRATEAHPDAAALHGGLLALALIFAEEGAPERALELYALARRQPMIGNSQTTIAFFDQRLNAAATALPSEVAHAAQARGRGRDPWATAHELLAELEAAEWGSDS